MVKHKLNSLSTPTLKRHPGQANWRGGAKMQLPCSMFHVPDVTEKLLLSFLLAIVCTAGN